MGDPEGNGDERQPWREVERRGLLAANDLVDRLVGKTADGGEVDDEPAETARAPTGPGADPGEGGVADLVHLWVDVVRVGLDTLTQSLAAGWPGRRSGTGSTGGSPGTALDVVSGTSSGVVRVRVSPTADGEAPGGTAVVWLHNGGDGDVPDVALHCGDLRASDGAVLPASSVRFEPAAVELPARSSRGVLVSVQAAVAPGRYRGVLLATGVPEAWLPLDVTVPGSTERDVRSP